MLIDSKSPLGELQAQKSKAAVAVLLKRATMWTLSLEHFKANINRHFNKSIFDYYTIYRLLSL